MSTTKLCQTCVARGADIDIHSFVSGVPLIDLISRCSGKKMSLEGLPGVVCQECHALLKQFNEFGVRACMVEDFLLKQLSVKEEFGVPIIEPSQILIANGAENSELLEKNQTETKLVKKAKKGKRKQLKLDIKATQIHREGNTDSTLPVSDNADSDHDIPLSTYSVCMDKGATKENFENSIDGEDHLEKGVNEHDASMRDTTRSPVIRQKQKKKRRLAEYQCEWCDYCAADRYSLRVHVRFHTGERPFPCTNCHKTFTIASNLKAHLRTHSGERPFVCEQCGRAFSAAASLRGHVRTHTGERPYACASCPRAFTLRSNLRQHSRVHSGEKPYSCDICSKPFSSSSDARAHRRVHTGERPFACAACPRRFALACNLRSHTRVHRDAPLGEHVCQACGQQFTRKSALSAHTRTHKAKKSTEADPQHVCNTCGKRFARKCNLGKHKRKQKSCSDAPEEATNKDAALADEAPSTDQSQTSVVPSQNVIVQSQQIITADTKLSLERQPHRTPIAGMHIVQTGSQRVPTLATVFPLTLVPISILR